MKAYALFIRQGYYGSLPTSQIKEVEFVKKVDFGAIIRVDGSEVKIGAQEDGWLAYGSTFNNTGWYGYAFTPSAAAALQVHWFEENIKEWEERSRKAQEVATKWKEALKAIERQSMKTPPFNTSPDIPVGTRVRYYPVSGEFDFIESVTRTPAWKPYPAADHHYVSIDGKSGGLLLSHIEIIEP